MTSYSQIFRWLDEGEGPTLDYKERITHPYKIAKLMAAFSNHKGGTILIGVSDDKELLGVENRGKQIEMLNQASKQYCDPEINFYLQEFVDEDLLILIVQIPKGLKPPYGALDKNNELNYYVRAGDKSLLASKELIRNLKSGKRQSEPVIIKHYSHEKSVIDFIKRRGRMTQKEMMSLLNFSKRRTKRMLVDMTNSGILFHHDHEKEDYYTLANI